ncbi:hypothetical protein KEM60_02385 [Austwickia sp. TVS 96-490-7B]|nr:hypothetical protein [Austwickia sp. TVS 96-490-7B]
MSQAISAHAYGDDTVTENPKTGLYLHEDGAEEGLPGGFTAIRSRAVDLTARVLSGARL